MFDLASIFLSSDFSKIELKSQDSHFKWRNFESSCIAIKLFPFKCTNRHMTDWAACDAKDIGIIINQHVSVTHVSYVWKCFWKWDVESVLSYLHLQSYAFGKIGQALGLNLSAVATGGTEQNGAICPLDGNTDCYIFSLSPALSSLYSSIFRCSSRYCLTDSHYRNAFGEHELVNSFDIR